MKNQDLTRYLFYDGHEQVANSRKRVVAFRDPGLGVNDYLSLTSGLRAKYIRGSTPDFRSKEFSKEPKIDEHLISRNWFLWWGEWISNSKIKQIDKDFHFPKNN